MAIKLSEKQIKDGWQIVKFGEIARQCKESVDRENNPFERYVEGGHMDSENLRITRWGEFGDHYVGPAFHRIFRKGQILYGSRRTYLKKVAVADFDGITANTTFVMEPRKPEVLLPGLLPFIMLSDDFTNHSVLNSKGSTNPYINWRDIAKYEFPLPPLDRQKEILEVLEKVEDANSILDDCIESCLISLRRLVDYACNSDRNKEPFSNSRRFRLKDICKSNLRSLGTKADDNYEFGYVDISSCSFPGLLKKPERMKFNDAPSRARRIVSDGDVLVSAVRPNHQATYIFQAAKDIIASTGFSVISPNDKKYSKWIFYSTLTKQFVYNLSNLMVGTSFPAVSDDDIMIQCVDIPEEKLFEIWLGALDSTCDLYNNLLTKQKRFSEISKNALKVSLESQEVPNEL